MQPSKRQHLSDSPVGQMLENMEKIKASIRAKVERSFHLIKDLFRRRKTRYRGLAKNHAQLLNPSGLANLMISKRRNAQSFSPTRPERRACMRILSARVARRAVPSGDAMNGVGKVVQYVCDEAQHVVDCHENARQYRVHGAVGLSALTARVRREIGLGLGGLAHQGGDVFGKHPGGHLHQQRVLAQT